MPVKVRYSDELYHHGIKGQKWGIRRFQNQDGSLTPEGLKRYGRDGSSRKPPNDRQKKMVKNLTSTWYHNDISQEVPDQVFSILGADKKVLNDARASVRNEYKNYSKTISNFSSNNVVKAYDEYYNDYGESDYNKFWNGISKVDRYKLYAESEIANSMNSLGIKDPTMSDISWWIYLGCYEDGQQGKIDGMRMHIAESIPKESLDAAVYADDKLKKIVDDSKIKIRQELERVYGKDSKDCEDLADRITYMIDRQSRKSVVGDNGSYAFNNISNIKNSSQRYNPDIKFAKDIIKHLEGTHPASWEGFSETMVDDLGLLNKHVSDMTDKDWEKVRNELNKYGGNVKWFDKYAGG